MFFAFLVRWILSFILAAFSDILNLETSFFRGDALFFHRFPAPALMGYFRRLFFKLKALNRRKNYNFPPSHYKKYFCLINKRSIFVLKI